MVANYSLDFYMFEATHFHYKHFSVSFRSVMLCNDLCPLEEDNHVTEKRKQPLYKRPNRHKIMQSEQNHIIIRALLKTGEKNCDFMVSAQLLITNKYHED